MPTAESSAWHKSKYFRKGEKLTKSYIIQKMVGNEAYGKYVPNRINPHNLSREFLLSVRYNNIILLAYFICRAY